MPTMSYDDMAKMAEGVVELHTYHRMSAVTAEMVKIQRELVISANEHGSSGLLSEIDSTIKDSTVLRIQCDKSMRLRGERSRNMGFITGVGIKVTMRPHALKIIDDDPQVESNPVDYTVTMFRHNGRWMWSVCYEQPDGALAVHKHPAYLEKF